MEDNLCFYPTENTFLCNSEPLIIIESDSEEYGYALTIDLGADHNKIKTEDDDNDDDLSIVCEENESCVNFYIKGEKTNQISAQSASSEETNKNSEMEHKRRRRFFMRSKKNMKDGNTDKKLHKDPKKNYKTSFACPACPFKGKTNFMLNRHMEFHYFKNAKYRCSVCTFGADSRTVYNSHLKLHNDTKADVKQTKIRCPLCKFTGTCIGTMQHFKVHAKQNEHLKDILECPMCNAKTKSSNFPRHSKNHILPKFGRKPKKSRVEKDNSKNT